MRGFFHIDTQHVALCKPVGRLLLMEALPRVAVESPVTEHLGQTVVSDLEALTPVLLWIKGISHFLADVCAKSLPHVRLGAGNEALTSLGNAALWESHILTEVLAGWGQFGAQCLQPAHGCLHQVL